MSTILAFNREFSRSDVNILTCLTLERKDRLRSTVAMTPWAAGLTRLLAERRLKKGALAELSKDESGKPMRAGTISAVLNSDAPPEVRTLLRIADGFAAFDRLHPDQKFPPVELWEFFVSDEQSELLRHRDAVTRAVVDERALRERVKQQLIAEQSERIERIIDGELRAVSGGAKAKSR